MNITKHLRLVILLLAILHIGGNLSAQVNDRELFAKIIDRLTREPIVFATIIIGDTETGVISNKNGVFRIPLEKLSDVKILKISSMGYSNRTIQTEDLVIGSLNIIELSPYAIALDESVVTAKRKRLSAKKIVQNAINKIDYNYPKQPYEYVGYFRNYQWKDENYVNMREAIIKVSDFGFQTVDTSSTNFRVLTEQRNKIFPIDTFALKPYNYEQFDKTIPYSVIDNYQDNEFALLRVHDPIRNYQIKSFSFIYELTKDLIPNHAFRLLETTNFGTEKVYKIAIRKRIKNVVAKGILYIDQSDYSFRKIDYEVFYERSENQNNNASHYENNNLLKNSEKVQIFSITVEYRRKVDGKMYLNYISMNNSFNLIYPPTFFIKNVTLNRNLQQLEIELNCPAVNWTDLEFSDFGINYKDEEIKLDRVIDKDLSTYIFKVDFENTKQRELLNVLFSKTIDQDKSSLKIRMEKLVNEKGDMLGERKSKTLIQFREFFVQEILSEGVNSISTSKEMNEQNISTNLKEFDKRLVLKYWMNTPLLTAEK